MVDTRQAETWQVSKNLSPTHAFIKVNTTVGKRHDKTCQVSDNPPLTHAFIKLNNTMDTSHAKTCQVSDNPPPRLTLSSRWTIWWTQATLKPVRFTRGGAAMYPKDEDRWGYPASPTWLMSARIIRLSTWISVLSQSNHLNGTGKVQTKIVKAAQRAHQANMLHSFHVLIEPVTVLLHTPACIHLLDEMVTAHKSSI